VCNRIGGFLAPPSRAKKSANSKPSHTVLGKALSKKQ